MTDTDAARRARQKALKESLADAYEDDEASPPEWVDILARTKTERTAILEAVDRATAAYVSEPDIRRALKDRDAFASRTRERIVRFNEAIKRLNLVAPHSRFTRAGLDPEDALRPLFRTRRGRT